jgi:phosphoglycolate phosphatase
MKRCVVFDLDGTLCDTAEDLIAAANAALDRLGRRERLDPAIPADRATALRGGRAMLRRAFAMTGPVDERLVDEGYTPLLDAYAEAVCVHTTFYPGAREAVARLRAAGDAVAICTNKPEGLARALMEALGAAAEFDALIGADTLPVKKPDPAPLREAVARAGGFMERAVLIGDTDTDRDTAAAAGVPSILVTFGPSGRAVSRLGPDALLEDYARLEAVLGSVGL